MGQSGLVKGVVLITTSPTLLRRFRLGCWFYKNFFCLFFLGISGVTQLVIFANKVHVINARYLLEIFPQTTVLSFFQVCLYFPNMLMNEFWNITENNIENKA